MAEGIRRRRQWFRRWWRKADRVVVTAVVFPLLALLGVIGAGESHFLRSERFDAKQVIVVPSGPSGLRITEIVDVDFARRSRHGYERTIPDDFGAPVDVSATSTANADVDIEGDQADDEEFDAEFDEASETRIRVGSRDATFRGRQRYELSYTLPSADLSSDRLSLDVIGTEETLATGHFDIWITGLRLDDVSCDRGRWAERGGCTFVERDGMWFTSIDRLEPGEGITVTADVAGRSDALEPQILPPPAGWWLHWEMALLLLATSVATLGALYVFSRWNGTNRVGAGGGAGAAFPDSGVIARRIPDAELVHLAATDFSPPTGMRPWQGALVVNEAIDERSIVAWFSELVAIGALELDVSDTGSTSIRRAVGGPALTPEDQTIVDDLFRDHADVTFSAYGAPLADAWRSIARQQVQFASESGWWHRNVPTYRAQRGALRPNWSLTSFVVIIYSALSYLVFRSLLTPLIPLSWALSKPVVCVVAAVGTTAFAAYRAFAPIRPARSVPGTAMALRVLGFRKFLAHSEGRHVDAAWDRGRIREYSGWAVALGAATAWADRIEVLPAPGEAIRLDWAKALDRVMTSIDLDSVVTTDPAFGDNRVDPWGAIGRGMEAAASNPGVSSGSSSGFDSSSSDSSSVGSGGGGGSSGTW